MLDPAARFVTDIVRDSDKLDIFRVMVSYLGNALPERDAVLLHVADDPGSWTPKVAEDVTAGRVAGMGICASSTTFVCCSATWMLELRFASTRKALAESGLMDEVLAGLPDAPGLRPAREKLHVLLEDCRNGRGAAR